METRETVRAFNLMRGRLDRYVRDRTAMLAAVSHDLRTPITSLRLHAEFVEAVRTKRNAGERGAPKPCSRPLPEDRHAAAAAWVGSVRRHWALSQHLLRLRPSRVARQRIAHQHLATPRPPWGCAMRRRGAVDHVLRPRDLSRCPVGPGRARMSQRAAEGGGGLAADVIHSSGRPAAPGCGLYCRPRHRLPAGALSGSTPTQTPTRIRSARPPSSCPARTPRRR